MRTLIATATLLSLPFSTVTTAQEYGGQYNPWEFDTVVSVTAGEVDFEYADERDDWVSGAVAADFANYPVELEFRYGTADRSETILGVDAKSTWNNYGLTAKVDLSRSCQAACIYLLAGYNYGENEVTAEFEGESYREKITGNYAHVGAGFRYEFAQNLRLLLEWTQYNVGEQDHKDLGEIDFGHARIWQAGMAFRF